MIVCFNLCISVLVRPVFICVVNVFLLPIWRNKDYYNSDALRVWPWLSLSLAVCNTLRTSSFMDDVRFSFHRT